MDTWINAPSNCVPHCSESTCFDRIGVKRSLFPPAPCALVAAPQFSGVCVQVYKEDFDIYRYIDEHMI